MNKNHGLYEPKKEHKFTFGLWTVGKLPPLKRFFMRDAMGLAGDLPEMMRNVKRG